MATNTFSRHHALVVALLLFVLILGVTAYVLQRNEGIKTVAGEAFRQRASPPADFNLNIPNSDPGNIVTKTCPDELVSNTQDWDLPGWKLVPWRIVDVRCSGKSIYCAYADPLQPSSASNYYFKDYQPDHLTYIQGIEWAEKCTVSPNIAYTCQCQKLGTSPDKIY